MQERAGEEIKVYVGVAPCGCSAMLMSSECSGKDKAEFKRDVRKLGYQLKVIPPSHPANRAGSCPACDGDPSRLIDITMREEDKGFITWAMLRMARDIERAGFRFAPAFVSELNAWASAQPLVELSEPLPSPRAALPECVRVLVEREVKALTGEIARYESLIRVHQTPQTWADEVHVQRTVAEHQSRLDMKRAELADLQRALAGAAE